MDAFCEADCRKWHLLRNKPWRRSRPGSYALNVGARHLKFKAKTIYIYCITAARSITVRRSSTDDHGCSASIMLAMVSSLPRVPSSFCLLFALRWLRNTRKSVARTKQCCLLSQERNLQRSPKSKCFRVFPIRNLLFVKKPWEFCNFGLCEPHGERPCDLLTWTVQWKTWRCDVKDC